MRLSNNGNYEKTDNEFQEEYTRFSSIFEKNVII